MIVKGNYWVELLEKERRLQIEIEVVIKRFVGVSFLTYDDMTNKLKDNIRIQIENYGVKHHMGIFNIEYDLNLKYDDNYLLNGGNVKYILLDEDVDLSW